MMLEILVRASLEGAILVGAVWALCRFVPRLSPATRTALWWCVAAKFVLALVWTAPVDIPILPAAASVQEARAAGAGQLGVVGEAATPAGAGSTTGSAGPTRSTPRAVRRQWTAALIVAWMLGVVATASAGARRWRRMAGLIARSAPSPAATDVMTSDLASCLGLRRVPRVRVSNDVGTPLVIGILQPLVLLPAGAFDALTERQQRMALCHELTHIKRADLWLGCVPAIAERVFFFHPLVHFAAREYALCREAACDAHVLAVMDAAPQEYGRLLLGLGVSRTRTSLAAAGAPWSFSTLRRRIAMLDSQSPRSIGSRTVAAIVIGVAALSIVPLRISARQAPAVTAVESPAWARFDFPTWWFGPARAWLGSLMGSGLAQRERDLNFVMFVDDDRSTMSGSERDIERARRARIGNERMLWFRHAGQEYVVRDRAILQEIVAIWEPVNVLGDEQGKLGTRQGELGTKQGELGTRQGELGTQQGNLGTRQGALGARQGAMAARDYERLTEAERRAFDEERRQIEREMRALDAEMRKLDPKMRELDKPMRDLGAQMEVLGKEMEVLGRKMEEEGRRAETRMRALLERAVTTGIAQAVR